MQLGRSGGACCAGASTDTLVAMQSDSLLDNVSKMVDGKAATVMSGVGGQLSQVGCGNPGRHPGRRWPMRYTRAGCRCRTAGTPVPRT